MYHPSEELDFRILLILLCQAIKWEIAHLISNAKQMEDEIYEYAINYNNKEKFE